MAKKNETEIAEQAITQAEAKEEAVDIVEQHIDNQLIAINRMTNKARAKRLARRVLNNRKGIK